MNCSRPSKAFPGWRTAAACSIEPFPWGIDPPERRRLIPGQKPINPRLDPSMPAERSTNKLGNRPSDGPKRARTAHSHPTERSLPW